MLGNIIAVVAALIWYFFIRPLSYWTILGVKQSNPLIFFGDSWRTVLRFTSLNDFMHEMYNLHVETRYIGFYNFTKPILLLRDPEIIKQITVKNFDHFTDHPPFADPNANPFWSNGLLSLKGQKWKAMRKTLSPAFTSSKIKTIYILMSETAEHFVQQFYKENDNVVEVEMMDVFTRFTNDILATMVFGVQGDSLRNDRNIFYEMGKKISHISTVTFLSHRVFPKFFKNLSMSFLDKDASKYFYGIMNETIKLREEKSIVRPDLVHLMLEARKENVNGDNGLKDKGISNEDPKLSNKEITSQAITFFIAGFDTVSVSMCYAAYELAVNQNIQDRLRQEVNQTQKDGKVNYEDLVHMKYMDMVLSEVFRKWPPFPFISRLCTKPFTIEPTEPDETPLPLPLNQNIWLPIYGLHRDPKYFPNPEKFDPERFSEENKVNIVPYSYIPFGAGPRICIGNRFALIEIKVLLANMLLRFEIVPTTKTPIPLVLRHDISQLPKDGFYLGLKRI